ncbi:MAG TPA: c-type cytochrome [Gemmatimonadaceae bacterium]|nr:c-type cytochrome [Gemmatimonadaceae bacterium]
MTHRIAFQAAAAAAAALWIVSPLRAQAGHNAPREPGVPPGAIHVPKVKTHDDLQPDTLPTLPTGMTVQMIAAGDSIFHNEGRCFACHGQEAEGMPAAGDALTAGLNWAQPNWHSIDSLITSGMPQELTRSPIAMPPRGGKSDLTDAQVHLVAAYVWAISQTRGEPWPGGHQSHNPAVPNGPAPSPGTSKPRARAATHAPERVAHLEE